ncbi:MAG TPA: hypothetical protein VIH97_11185 [Candidatus Acidoferrales bacterium]
MLRNGAFLPGFLAAILMTLTCAPRAAAQEAVGQNPPPYRGVQTHVDGVFVTPVPNVPMTAVVEVQSTQMLDDGTSVSKKTFNNIARDSQGRIYNERRALEPDSFDGTPPIISMHIYDPSTKLNTFMEVDTRLARQSVRLETTPALVLAQSRPSVAPVNRPGYQEQDLGTESMENVVVHGLRKTRTIPANASGTGKPVVVTDEYWYSEELHLNMLVKHDDPRTGQQTVAVTQVNRSEPSPSMFEIPADYKIVDETPVPR